MMLSHDLGVQAFWGDFPRLLFSIRSLIGFLPHRLAPDSGYGYRILWLLGWSSMAGVLRLKAYDFTWVFPILNLRLFFLGEIVAM